MTNAYSKDITKHSLVLFLSFTTTTTTVVVINKLPE